jgi:hypothetical protein
VIGEDDQTVPIQPSEHPEHAQQTQQSDTALLACGVRQRS